MQKKIEIGVRLNSAARKDGKREGEACAWLDGKKAVYEEVFGGWVFEVEKVDFWRTKEPFPEDFAALGAELATAKKIGAILKNNYNNRLAAEVLPALVEILKKYNGKKYGEKTKEKMGEEFKAMTGGGLYLERCAFSQECRNAHVYEMRAAFNKAVDAYNALTVNGIEHEQRA